MIKITFFFLVALSILVTLSFLVTAVYSQDIHQAVRQGDLNKVKTLLENNPGLINAQDVRGCTPLHYAAGSGHKAVIVLLLEKGGKVDLKNNSGDIPLHWAAYEGHTEVAELLIEKGARVDAPDRNGRTPLHMAVVKGNAELADLLLEKDAKINSKDKEGKSALDFARQYMHPKLVNLLITNRAEAYVHKKDFDVSPGLDDPLQKGDAVIWHLGHAGWAVKTKTHLLVFDYSERAAPVSERRLANGYINPSEIQDQNVIVFVSHQHWDHFDRRIFEWQEKVKTITYVFGWKAADNPDYVYLKEPRGKIKIGDVEVYTINDNHDGVPEVAYLVKADGVVIYHSGDYVGRLDSFRDDINYFVGQCGRVDLLFTYLVGNTSKYAVRRLKPVSAFPMHAFGMEYFYQRAALNLGKAHPRTKMFCGEFQGDRFIYHKGKISRVK